MIRHLEMPASDIDVGELVGICFNPDWKVALLSLFSDAEQAERWLPGTDIDRIEQNAFRLYEAILNAETCGQGVRVHYIGEVFSSWSANVPDGCLSLHSAQTLQKADYPDLWSAIAPNLRTATTITLPAMKGRTIVGQGFDYNYPGGQPFLVNPGVVGGEYTHTLQPDEMPVHTHTRNPDGHGERVLHNTTAGTSTFAGSGNRVAVTGLIETGSAGGNEPHDNMQPFAGAYWYIQAL